MNSQCIVLTLLNMAYLAIIIISTMKVYDVFHANQFSTDSLNEIDGIFIAIYCLPASFFYLATSMVICYVVGTMNRNEYYQMRPDIVLLMWCNVILFKQSPDTGRRNIISTCCDAISRNIIISIINIILVFVTLSPLLCLLPITAISLHWDRSEPLRYVGFIIQTTTVTINILFHMFCLDAYGYYSLSIVLLCLFHLFVGITYHGSHTPEPLQPKQLLWIVFEILSALTVLSITFVVDYNDNLLYTLTLICFFNYLFPNIPFFKLYLHKRYTRMQSTNIWRFLRQYNLWRPVPVYDKCYFLLHDQLYHHHTTKNTNVTELTNLLSTSLSPIYYELHEMNSVLCFKMQYEYLKSSTNDKIRIIKRLHPRWKINIAVNITLYLYAISSMIAFLYPMFWFFYVLIYKNIVLGSDAIQVGNDINAQYIFIINISYLIMSIYWCMITVRVLMEFTVNEIIREKAVALFSWSLQGSYYGDIFNAKRMYTRAPSILPVMNATGFQSDIALIVLSYL